MGIKLRFETDINIDKLQGEMKARGRLAQKRLAAAILADSNKFIPMRTGALKRSGDIRSQNTVVQWATRYASAVYRMVLSWIKKNVNPNATSRWFDHAKAINGKNWIRLVKDTMRGKK